MHWRWQSKSFVCAKEDETGEVDDLDGRWLEKHPKVAWVSYLGLESHESYQDALRVLRPNAFGGMLTFGVKGDARVGSEVVDKMKLASNLANVGASSLLATSGGCVLSMRVRDN